MRKFFAMEAKGQLPKGEAKKWVHETPNIKRLPEVLGKTKMITNA